MEVMSDRSMDRTPYYGGDEASDREPKFIFLFFQMPFCKSSLLLIRINTSMETYIGLVH